MKIEEFVLCIQREVRTGCILSVRNFFSQSNTISTNPLLLDWISRHNQDKLILELSRRLLMETMYVSVVEHTI